MEIERIFEHAKHEVFEDGYDSVFSRDIEDLIYNKNAVREVVEYVRTYLQSERKNSEVASEALRVLGRIEHEPSRSIRLRLLTESLSHNSYWVRDGATIGISSMEDVAAIPYLEEAAKCEKEQSLMEYMFLTAKELRDGE